MEVPLGHTTLFRGLSDTASEDLAAAMDRRSISRGSVIFKKDDHGDSMFVILSGRVRDDPPRNERSGAPSDGARRRRPGWRVDAV